MVKDGKTGFVVEPLDKDGKPNVGGLARAIRNIGKIKREDCRRWVEERFTIDRMVDEYERIYYKAVC